MSFPRRWESIIRQCPVPCRIIKIKCNLNYPSVNNKDMTRFFPERLEGPISNFMICAIIQKGTDRRMIKNLKDGENKGEKSMQPYRK